MSVIACEVLKSILMLKKPSIKLDESKEMLFSIIPEFKESYGFDQNTPWHIYDVYNHTLKVVDNVALDVEDKNDKLSLRIAALFHDMGKPYTYEEKDGVGHFPSHWTKSLAIFNEHYKDFNLSNDEVILIRKLILLHDLRPGSGLTVDMVADMLNESFADKIDLLFDIKEADILGGNPEYYAISKEQLEDIKSHCKTRKIIH